MRLVEEVETTSTVGEGDLKTILFCHVRLLFFMIEKHIRNFYAWSVCICISIIKYFDSMQG